MKLKLILLFILGISCSIFGQQRFHQESLRSPQRSGADVSSQLHTVEVSEYEKPKANAVILKNGFRKFDFINAQDWLKIRDSVLVTKVQIVFSKYPLRNGEYKEIYPLLFNRIKATIALDPALNDTSIVWERVWQTNCRNNEQVDSLFHGVVVHYSNKEKKQVVKVQNATQDTLIPHPKPNETMQKVATPMSPVLAYMLAHPTTPESLRQTAKELSTKEAEMLVLNYYRSEAKNLPEGPITDPAVQLNYMYELEVFSRQFPSADTVVGKVFDRHPEWRQKIVVNDWTGSMYGYGSQVLLWHLMNLENSGITSITLFNDGDNKPTSRKKIGRTKGIYSAEANNPAEVIDLFNSVMRKGAGGDGPENDIEAILSALKNAPEAELILIADNAACVRDINLAHKINRPVRIILCGYKPEEGVNPDYVYLASITNGGIYTLEDDLEQLRDNVTISDGAIVKFDDERFKISSPQCFEDVFYTSKGRHYNLKKSRWHKKDVRILDASNVPLEAVPGFVFRMPNLQSLDLSKNFLTEINESIGDLSKLSELDLSRNNISALPESMERNRFLEHLNISHNAITTLPDAVYSYQFLREIDVSNNRLKSLEAFQSKILTTVNVSNNELEALPNFDKNTELVVLFAAHNQLIKFPTHLPLHQLEEIDLSYNNIQLLPEDLTPFIGLKKLNLQGNPISTGERIRIRQALYNVDLTF